ncbi:MAG: response regulator [Nostoc sp.]|uniref:response regulator n=1 Tax=Nostoc sp. TaxID=1180 RepID=UPI002FF8F9C2
MANLLKSASETNILIVDDTPDNLRLLTKILESQGYIIRKSLNGRMALQAAYRYPPDLILLDINMPEMNGYEVCQQLKASKTTDQIPIIFISALDQINDKVQAFELGGQDYITKPFQELEVLMRVKNQLLIKQQYQQLLEQNQRLEHEIQERLKAEADIRQLSLTDDLTGLYNRRGFFWLANQQFKIARRTQMLCCLLFVDLDGLKQINDSLGHEIGDRIDR